ncbi:hypothetical protein H9660_14240 [Clostridium sp. Sa3CUN1]|uniref:C2H2-type domain-containing protein n=1 Tax=Clostridium gallinarum TaxID=2762246 RepID=A0ABR8Q7A6_9CLOT|nr:hypothetical protein [Clostridium gallinarum]MBD7916303.1 hypothetical protein [Clostridium gallinarum]
MKAKCKHCGRRFELHKPFGDHLAYDHDIYVSKWYRIKAKIRKVSIFFRKEVIFKNE